MALSLDTTKSLFSNQQLSKTDDKLATSLAKLSSAQRVNKAADDASSLTIADSLNSEARSLGQSARNASDAVSLLQVADGALGQSTEMVNSIRVKSLQAANASQSTASRQALQADISSAVEQLGNISKNTTYNSQSLLSGEFTNKNFQIGTTDSISISISSADPSQLGSEESGMLSEIDITTIEGAQAAIQAADAALEQINTNRSQIGSSQNKLASTISTLSTTRINTIAAESNIRDLDFAAESINLSRMDTLFKVQSFASTQANAGNKNVLNLLQDQT